LVVLDAVGMPLARPLAVVRKDASTRSASPRPFELESEVGTRVLDVGEEPPNGIRAVLDPADGRQRRPRLDVFRTAGQLAIDVPVVDRSDRALDDLDVLL
jgi:hypothetical protein